MTRIALVRTYAQQTNLETAVERAIEECIHEGILAEFLKKNRAEVKKVSIYEYDYEKHMRQEREENFEAGREDGLAEGIARGKILARYEDGMPPKEIARKMGLTVQQVEALLKECKI